MKDKDFEVDNDLGLPEVEFNVRFEHFWRLFVEYAERGMEIKKIDLLMSEVRKES